MFHVELELLGLAAFDEMLEAKHTRMLGNLFKHLVFIWQLDYVLVAVLARWSAQLMIWIAYPPTEQICHAVERALAIRDLQIWQIHGQFHAPAL